MKYIFGGKLVYETNEFEEIMTFLAEKAGDPEIRVAFTVFPNVESLAVLGELETTIADELEKLVKKHGGLKA